jgi:SAM-dependent methyltransferase
MLDQFLDVFDSHRKNLLPTHLELDSGLIPVRNGIPRFSPDISYSSGNFSVLRERHATLQLDSVNGTTDRMQTFLNRTGWTEQDLRGKLVLECGCGAGPDTEILLALGARVVAVDLAGTDIAQENLGQHPELCLVQASIDDLPFKPASFDIVFCHRVIMHTPDPAGVMEHILGFVKPGGKAFVHSYSRDFYQMFRWKYPLRPITKRMSPERLYRLIEKCTPFLFSLTKAMNSNRYLRRLCWHFVPYINHRHQPKYADLSDEKMREMAIHETFDALSPQYDNPLSTAVMSEIASRRLDVPFEIVHGRAFVLMRTL